jgi:uncharacterized protein involved in tellurium resistance
MSTTPKSWINAKRTSESGYGHEVQIFIDETFEKIEHVDGLKTTLFPHQKPVVKAMMDLEMNRTFKVNTVVKKNLKSAQVLVFSVRLLGLEKLLMS